MSAGNNESPGSPKPTDSTEQLASIKRELDTQLAEITNQIKAQNEAFQAMYAQNKPAAREEIDDSDVFDARTLNKKVFQTAESVARDLIQEDRRKNSTIYQMTQDYPEISTDRELQKAILEAQKTLPKSMQDTAEGYEMAVLKAVAKQGLVAKSKRVAPSDDDFSVGGSRGARQRAETKSRKVSNATLEAAELLRGRALTEDEKKGLESAVNRDSYNKYR